MTQEDYVTYEQAIRLKELGFDWDCNWYYETDSKELVQSCSEGDSNSDYDAYDNFNDGLYIPSIISAPTLSQVAKWLRKEGLFIDVWRNELGYNWDIDYNYVAIECESTKKFNTYEDALFNAMDKALEILKTRLRTLRVRILSTNQMN